MPRPLFAVATAWLLATSTTARAEEPAFDAVSWQAPYQLAVPPGWQSERFALPIGFAPHIPYQGVEDLRFAQGWRQSASDQYWTYAFLWYLDGTQRPSTKTLTSHLQSYFNGLVAVNSEAPAADATDRSPTLSSTETNVSLRKAKRRKGDIATYRGTIRTRDYLAQAPLTLHATIHVRLCPASDKTLLFFKLSPKPFAHAVWKDLHALWDGVACPHHGP